MAKAHDISADLTNVLETQYRLSPLLLEEDVRTSRLKLIDSAADLFFTGVVGANMFQVAIQFLVFMMTLPTVGWLGAVFVWLTIRAAVIAFIAWSDRAALLRGAKRELRDAVHTMDRLATQANRLSGPPSSYLREALIQANRDATVAESTIRRYSSAGLWQFTSLALLIHTLTVDWNRWKSSKALLRQRLQEMQG